MYTLTDIRKRLTLTKQEYYGQENSERYVTPISLCDKTLHMVGSYLKISQFSVT